MFIDRKDAALQLTKKLDTIKNEPNLVVFAIPRGGLPLGAAVARALHAPLDVLMVRKITPPFDKELAVGAATPTFFFVDPAYEPLSDKQKAEIAEVQLILSKRALVYRQYEALGDLTGKTAVVVDDGVATGHTMHATIKTLQQHHAAKIIILTPVISASAAQWLTQDGATVVSIVTPTDLTAVGSYYQNFDQVTDQEAMRILQQYELPSKESAV